MYNDFLMTSLYKVIICPHQVLHTIIKKVTIHIIGKQVVQKIITPLMIQIRLKLMKNQVGKNNAMNVNQNESHKIPI